MHDLCVATAAAARKAELFCVTFILKCTFCGCIFVSDDLYTSTWNSVLSFSVGKILEIEWRVERISLLTLILLVANQYKINTIQKTPEKSLKPWHMGTHLRVLKESYLMNTNMTGFRWFSKIFAFCALEQVCL